MLTTSIVTLAAGILATAGLGAMVLTARAQDTVRHVRFYNLGKYALCLGGLVLMVGSVAGWSGAGAMVCGLLIVAFGADARQLPAPAAKRESAQ
jgi:hypothetical protein